MNQPDPDTNSAAQEDLLAEIERVHVAMRTRVATMPMTDIPESLTHGCQVGQRSGGAVVGCQDAVKCIFGTLFSAAEPSNAVRERPVTMIRSKAVKQLGLK